MGQTDCKPPCCWDGAPPPMRGTLSQPPSIFSPRSPSHRSPPINHARQDWQGRDPPLAAGVLVRPTPPIARCAAGSACHGGASKVIQAPARCRRHLQPCPAAAPQLPAAACRRCRHSTCPLSHPLLPAGRARAAGAWRVLARQRVGRHQQDGAGGLVQHGPAAAGAAGQRRARPRRLQPAPATPPHLSRLQLPRRGGPQREPPCSRGAGAW